MKQKNVIKIEDDEISSDLVNKLYSGEVHYILIKNASEKDITKFGELEKQDLYNEKRVPVGSDTPDTEDHVWHTYEMMWHSDRAYMHDVHPFVGLYCVDAEKGSSPTCFADNFKAWSNLPEDLKKKVYEEDPVEFSIRTYFERTVYPHTFRTPAYERYFKIRSKAHHKIYRNDEWGEYLFYSSGYAKTKYYKELNEHAFVEENCWEHNWEPGDLLVWNNLVISHSRKPTAENIRRRLIRYAFHEPSDIPRDTSPIYID